MDFRSLLTDIPSRIERDLLISEVVKSDVHFKTLLQLALHEKDPLAWRASWVLDGADEKRPGMAREYIPEIVRRLPSLESKGTLRSLLRLLTRNQIPEDEQGLLIDLCFNYLVSELYPVAVKAYSMEIIYHHVLLYPELKHELITVIEDQAENNSAGFKARGTILINKMEKL